MKNKYSNTDLTSHISNQRSSRVMRLRYLLFLPLFIFFLNNAIAQCTSLPIVLPTLTVNGTASASVGGTSNLCIANPLPAAGTTLSATGGTVTTASGGYRIHTFTSSGTLTQLTEMISSCLIALSDKNNH